MVGIRVRVHVQAGGRAIAHHEASRRGRVGHEMGLSCWLLVTNDHEKDMMNDESGTTIEGDCMDSE